MHEAISWILTTYPTSAIVIAGTLMHEAISWILTTHPTSAVIAGKLWYEAISWMRDTHQPTSNHGVFVKYFMFPHRHI